MRGACAKICHNKYTHVLAHTHTCGKKTENMQIVDIDRTSAVRRSLLLTNVLFSRRTVSRASLASVRAIE